MPFAKSLSTRGKAVTSKWRGQRSPEILYLIIQWLNQVHCIRIVPKNIGQVEFLPSDPWTKDRALLYGQYHLLSSSMM
ncbi:hypothetical protein R6Q59_031374 [Mikania micrantha]